MYSRDGKEWFPAPFYKKRMIEARLFFRIYPNRIYKTPCGMIIPTLQPFHYLFYKENEPLVYLHDRELEYLKLNFETYDTLHLLSPIAEESPKNS